MLTADVRAGQPEFVAQKIAQKKARLYFAFVFLFIDRDCDGKCHCISPARWVASFSAFFVSTFAR